MLALCALLAGCVVRPPLAPQLSLTPVDFAALPGWSEDHVAAALPAFLASCDELAHRPDTVAVGPPALGMTAASWRASCAAAMAAPMRDDSAARAFFMRTFTPYLAGNNGVSDGLFTGYYEPLLRGARRRGGAFTVPILRRPEDLVMVELGRFRPAWRGERIAGRVVSGNLLPYPSRAEIERGALDLNRLALVWVDDPVAAFFLQVQGSGRVVLADGATIQLGYDGQNGQPYVAIGKRLVERGALTPDTVSLQSIRAWIAAHPAEGPALMDENPSYVFFRESDRPGPVGSEGVLLTPGRSLAVDAKFLPLGAPVYLAARQGEKTIQRLLVAQDTGGAITGPVRGDVFWGFGAAAEAEAGAMRAEGRFYLLLPKGFAPGGMPAAS